MGHLDIIYHKYGMCLYMRVHTEKIVRTVETKIISCIQIDIFGRVMISLKRDTILSI